MLLLSVTGGPGLTSVRWGAVIPVIPSIQSPTSAKIKGTVCEQTKYTADTVLGWTNEYGSRCEEKWKGFQVVFPSAVNVDYTGSMSVTL